ncbi:MAG TPA: YdeI/OmpD-associated family protein [Bacteroidales bacterium]|nr:YdeI/OmpD-associated family protein [Bacteroidales bacterium]
MTTLEQRFFEDKPAFRNWLEKNHDTSPDIWIVCCKKHVNTPCITHPDALRTALCFGRIDSIIKRLDHDRYIVKFTLRKNISKWSEVNKKLVDELIRSGEMTTAGLQKIESWRNTGKVSWENHESEKKISKETTGEMAIPAFILDELERHEPALTNFNRLAPSHKRNYVKWIIPAKRQETTDRRILEAAAMLKENKKPELK